MFFNSHIDEVKSVVPKDQLLIFDVKEGWEPLCTFLDRPVPDIPFPKVNDRRQLHLLYNTIRCVTWITLLCLPLLLSTTLSLLSVGWWSCIMCLMVLVVILFGAG